MSTVPHVGEGLVVRGVLSFRAKAHPGVVTEESFRIEISIPARFPQETPKVVEIGGRIPRNGDYHIYPDGTLCLGSPLELMMKLKAGPSLSMFVNSCLVPYLYAVSRKLQHGGAFCLGELSHGFPGLEECYMELLGLASGQQVRKAIMLLGLRKRIANKHLCPHGCGRRLGACEYRFKLDEFRGIASAAWFRAHAEEHWGKPKRRKRDV